MNNPNNKLSQQTSPYLLQHADNPVNWYAWNQQALDKAKQENKPILLSIGYSACHWCHVMAHESFENNDTARIMNKLFVNIKVDREERPDLDKIYQTAHSLLTSRPGGWPLTVFLSPDNLMPFFAGTYFPDQPRYQMPAFSEILQMASNAYQTRKDEIQQQDASLRQVFEELSSNSKPSKQLDALPLDLARKQMMAEFDHQYGGYSGAPKFPHPAIIERGMRYWAHMKSQQQDDEDVLDSALFTLQQMANGGIYDQLGGGFCRYSTDEQWVIPHFEKMLYDNGQLLPLYCQAYQITGEDIYKQAALGTANWCLREMQSAEGAYYSAQDADTEGEEGKFYVWRPEQIKQLLSEADYAIFAAHYGLDQAANFEGQWHLHCYTPIEKLAKTFQQSATDIQNALQRSREILFKERSQRIAPGTDDKILTAWNALMVRGMLLAGKTFEQPALIDSARSTLDFIQQQLWQDGRLLATYKDGKAHLNAYLDDYAYLLYSLLEYLQCRWDSSYLQWAEQLAHVLQSYFEDPQAGGFYFTSHDHEQLIQRSKSFSDDAIPNGNGIAALALQRLGLLTGNTSYLDSAEKCLKAGFENTKSHPITHASLLHALEEYLHPASLVIIRGKSEDTQSWQALFSQRYLPRIACFAIAEDEQLTEAIAQKKTMDTSCAYICEGLNCLPPLTDKDSLQAYLERHTYQPEADA